WSARFLMLVFQAVRKAESSNRELFRFHVKRLSLKYTPGSTSLAASFIKEKNRSGSEMPQLSANRKLGSVLMRGAVRDGKVRKAILPAWRRGVDQDAGGPL